MVLEMLLVWSFLVSAVLVVIDTVFADSSTDFADSFTAFFDGVGAFDGVDEEVLIELKMPN